MILRKSILRSFREKKLQYIGVTVLLILSLILYVSFSMAVSTLDQRSTIFSEKNNQEDFHFISSKTIGNQHLNTLASNYNITLEKRQYADILYQMNAKLRLFSLTNQVDIPYVTKGSLPKKEGEIGLSSVFADAHHLKVGDSINVNNHHLKITGFILLPDYIYILENENDLLNDTAKFGIGVAPTETLTTLSNQPITEVLGKMNGKKDIQDFKHEIASQFGLRKWLAAEDNPRIQFVQSEVEGAKSVTTTLPLFILALSVMMVLMLMKRRLEMQRKQIGTLMALGYTRRELIRHYLTYSIYIGLIGTILGLALGAALSIPLTNVYSDFYHLPRISYFDWDISVLIIGFVIPNIVLLAMTYLVIRKPLNQSPLSLLRPKEIAHGKKSWLEKLKLFRSGSFTHRFRLRLMIRSKSRMIYLTLGVVFSTILLMYGFISFNSMDKLINTTYKQILTYDYAVHYNQLQTSKSNISGSPFTTSEVKAKANTQEHKATIYGMNPTSDYVHLINDNEKELNKETASGFVVSQPLATLLNVKKGDSITLENSFNDKILTKTVVGITNLYVGQALFFNQEDVNQFLDFPKDSYTSVWTNEKPNKENNILMIENKQDILVNFKSFSGPIRYSVFGIAFFAMVIGVIVLTLLTNLIVEENSPSISLFKVMGYHQGEISKLILSVYTPVVIIAYFVSLPLATTSIKAMMDTLVAETGFTMPVHLNLSMVILGFLIMLVTYWISLFFSKRKLGKVSLQEALKKQQD